MRAPPTSVTAPVGEMVEVTLRHHPIPRSNDRPVSHQPMMTNRGPRENGAAAAGWRRSHDLPGNFFVIDFFVLCSFIVLLLLMVDSVTSMPPPPPLVPPPLRPPPPPPHSHPPHNISG